MRVNMGGQRARIILRMKFGMRENSGCEWIASVTPRGPTKNYSYCQAINGGEREERPPKNNITFYGQPNFVAG